MSDNSFRVSLDTFSQSLWNQFSQTAQNKQEFMQFFLHAPQGHSLLFFLLFCRRTMMYGFLIRTLELEIGVNINYLRLLNISTGVFSSKVPMGMIETPRRTVYQKCDLPQKLTRSPHLSTSLETLASLISPFSIVDRCHQIRFQAPHGYHKVYHQLTWSNVCLF